MNNRVGLYQAKQIKEFERIAIERFKISEDVMMQRAGKAALDLILQRWPKIKDIAIFCGGGNNGGDGYVVAHLSHERGIRVTVWQIGDSKHGSDLSKQINTKSFTEQSDIGDPDLIVDAICGIGLHSPLRKDAQAAVNKIQQSSAPILAIDVPTGIDADTGSTQGTSLRANLTITYIGIKVGLVTGAGTSCSGEIVLNDLQFPKEIYDYVDPVAELIRLNEFRRYLKPRAKDWHKGKSGHVLVIGGAIGFSGAPRMAAEAALRVGAGLVTVATAIENAALINVERPEIMADGVQHAEDLQPLLARASVVVIGPGLGQSEWAQDLLTEVLKTKLPLVVDADALNLLSKHPHTRENWILTPHPGEASRLLDISTVQIQNDRLASCLQLQKKYNGNIILKGAGTVVCTPGEIPAICDKGNPGMATAGMGDILSGVLGGLIAQQIPLGDAAKLGVYLHAAAGDLAAKAGERGMIAMDLMPYLRQLSNLS